MVYFIILLQSENALCYMAMFLSDLPLGPPICAVLLTASSVPWPLSTKGMTP